MSIEEADEIEDDDLEEDQRLVELHEECIREFTRVQTAMYEERQLSREDRRFVDIAGSQYDGLLFTNFDNKPKIEFNKVAQSVMRIINEYRNNPITVDFVSKDGEDTKLADVCDGLFRADMQASGGELAINNAFEEAVKGGLGAIRVTHVYEDDEDPDNENQRIRIEAIYDADTSVYFDLDAKNQDKSDAKKCWVLHSMTREAYAEEWGESFDGEDQSDPTSMPKDAPIEWFDWYTPDLVYIAEYFVIEEIKETVQIWTNLAGEEEKYWPKDFKDDPGLSSKLKAMGSTKTRSRRIPRKKVHKYIVDGAKVLEDCGIIAGKYIPVIPVYGMRSFIDGVERCRGQVRMSKDPQRLYNMQASKLAELAAFSSLSKPIVHPEQIAGHESLWAEDNIKDNPYLLLNMVLGPDGQTPVASGPIAYTQPPAVPPAMAALLQFSDTAMKEILGVNQEMQAVPANTSAEAINSVFNRMDMQVYIFVSNLAIALKWLGTVWLSMAKELYTQEGRKMKTIGRQDEVSSVTLMKPVIDKEGGGSTIYENDLTKASFEVVSSVGPSSTTKRQATVDTLLRLLPAVSGDPGLTKMITSLILYNSEGEGLADAREFVRADLVKQGVMKPTDEEAQAMAEAAAQAQPTAADQAQLAFAQAQQATANKTRAQVLQVLAEVEKIQAETERTRVEALEKMEGIDQSQREHAMRVLETLGKPAELPPIGGMGPGPAGMAQ